MKVTAIESMAVILAGVILCGCSRGGGPETHVLVIKPLSADRPIVTVTNLVITSVVNTSNYLQMTMPIRDLQHLGYEAIPASRWQEAYDIFSAALVDEARTCRLDSVSLSNCFKAILTAPESKGVALLPVVAYSGSQDGQKVWTIELMWEVADPRFSGKPMEHTRTHCFTQNGIKQVGFSRCR